MDNENFSGWLFDQIRASGKTQLELARDGGFSASQISRVLSGARDPGSDFCRGIARALDLPEETVFRKAGLMSPEPPDTELLRALVHFFNKADLYKQRMIVAAARAIAAEQEPAETKQEHPTTLGVSAPHQ